MQALECDLATLDGRIGAQINALRDLAARMESVPRYGTDWAALDRQAVAGERELERLMGAQAMVVGELIVD